MKKLLIGLFVVLFFVSCGDKLNVDEHNKLKIGMTNGEVHDILSQDPFTYHADYKKTEKVEVTIRTEYYHVDDKENELELRYRNDSLVKIHLY